jgi:hypothetical protein
VPFRSLHEIASLVARGRIVHPTADGVVLFRRDDIVQVRALAATAQTIDRSGTRPANR